LILDVYKNVAPKLSSIASCTNFRCYSFAQRIDTIWYSLLYTINFSSIARLKLTVEQVNFSKFVKYAKSTVMSLSLDAFYEQMNDDE